MAKRATSSKSKPKKRKTASPRSNKTPAKKARRASSTKAAPGDAQPADEIVVDRRRGDRRTTEESAAEAPGNPPLERRKKVNRRRQIDPTTCERDYSDDEIEFMNALDDYKRASGRMFPTCSEILEVIRSLGYSKKALADETPVGAGSIGDSTPEAGQWDWNGQSA